MVRGNGGARLCGSNTATGSDHLFGAGGPWNHTLHAAHRAVHTAGHPMRIDTTRLHEQHPTQGSAAGLQHSGWIQLQKGRFQQGVVSIGWSHYGPPLRGERVWRFQQGVLIEGAAFTHSASRPPCCPGGIPAPRSFPRHPPEQGGRPEPSAGAAPPTPRPQTNTPAWVLCVRRCNLTLGSGPRAAGAARGGRRRRCRPPQPPFRQRPPSCGLLCRVVHSPRRKHRPRFTQPALITSAVQRRPVRLRPSMPTSGPSSAPTSRLR